MHGGSLTAASEGPGKGSEFCVRLPLRTAPRQEPAGPQPVPEAPRRRILVADDNPDCVEMLALLLTKLGHEVETAADGITAIEVADAFRPDVVLLDIGMPRLDGYGAARWIREQPWGADVLIIAQTGWGQPDDRRRAFEAGFDDHLTKPVDLVRLQRALASATKPGPAASRMDRH
jgi:CheY-like chemotaxis protein